MPTDTISPPNASQSSRSHMAASIAAEQLSLAIDVVQSRAANLEHELKYALVGAVVQAIATNYLALATAPKK